MEFTYLDKINAPSDLQRLYNENPCVIDSIAQELRNYIIEVVIKNGGHLASNLGVIELTLALHLVFDTPRDTIVFDVGHQSYAHKILTGRRDDFVSLRTCNGINGFPKRSESVHDAFNTGHSSTSISAALGIARAKQASGDNSHTIAVIGDGSIAGGMAFEALNDVGQSEIPLIIILNDNEMAISGTVGAVGSHLSRIRASRHYVNLKRKTNAFLNKIPVVGKKLSGFLERTKNKIKYFLLPNVIFDTMGITYIGPIDGHDVKALQRVLSIAKEYHKPVIIHAVTKKGKGYAPAETDAEKYHGVSAAASKKKTTSNSKLVGEALIRLAGTNEKIVAVTAAMPSGTGLILFEQSYPDRFFDVGIAEQHAVTMAAGMASFGLRPYVAIYSTFLQRAYDQILHDVCLQKLPVVFGIDRAGLVGDDGETHQGVYDIAYLLTMPNMCIMSPSSQFELCEMLQLSFELDRPTAIRYNRGLLSDRQSTQPVKFGCWETIRPITSACIIATGRLLDNAIETAEALNIGLLNARFIAPVDLAAMSEIRKNTRVVITLEDGITTSGFGAYISQLLSKDNIKVYNFGVPPHPIAQGSVAQQDEMCGISTAALIKRIRSILNQNN